MTEDAIRRRLDAMRADNSLTLAPGTRRVYGTCWAGFEAWCGDNGFEALPASPLVVVGYLTHKSDTGTAYATLRTIRNAIASRHSRSGHANPTDSDHVRDCLRLLRRVAVQSGKAEPKQAPAILREHIDMYESRRPDGGPGTWYHVDTPEGALEPARWSEAQECRHWRDVAMLRTMHSAGLRSIEAANLRWSDIDHRDNGQAVVTIRRSKTSDAPMYRLITTKAVKALEQMRPEDWKPEDRVFRVKTGVAIHRRIQRAMSDTGIVPGASGHSPRVGMAQELTAEGASLQTLKECGGWKSLHMPAQYARKLAPTRGGVNLLED